MSQPFFVTVGVIIEETDILDIQHAIELSVQPDIINVYTNLMCGSRNHLRGFVRVYEALYGPYERSPEDSYLPDWEFVMIAYTEKEDCGGTERRGRRQNPCCSRPSHGLEGLQEERGRVRLNPAPFLGRSGIEFILPWRRCQFAASMTGRG